MTIVKTFTSNIIDEYGHKFVNAFVAIRAYSGNRQTTYETGDCIGDYKVRTLQDTLSYSINYWYEKQDMIDGLPSRPWKFKVLIDEVTDPETGEVTVPTHYEFGDVFNVDLEHPEAINIFNSEMEPELKDQHAIELDATRRNA